jgi:pimeloyl-ACP methyl ester carboxylesterase
VQRPLGLRLLIYPGKGYSATFDVIARQTSEEPTGRKIASLVPHSEFHTLDDGGHLPWLDDPEYAGRLVTDFLDRRRTVELVNN